MVNKNMLTKYWKPLIIKPTVGLLIKNGVFYMARPRTHHDEKKQELVKMAFELFMRDGYENTSIQDIMNVAQISKGAMYHYFTCKEDILDAVLTYIIDLDEKRSAPMLNSTTLRPIEKLTAMMSLDTPKAPPEVEQAAKYVMQRKDSIFDYRARELSKKRSIPSLASLIKEGVAAGEFHTQYPEEMAIFIYSSMQSIGESIALHRTDIPTLEKSINAIIELLTFCLGLKKKEQDFLADFFKKQFKF